MRWVWLCSTFEIEVYKFLSNIPSIMQEAGARTNVNYIILHDPHYYVRIRWYLMFVFAILVRRSKLIVYFQDFQNINSKIVTEIFTWMVFFPGSVLEIKRFKKKLDKLGLWHIALKKCYTVIKFKVEWIFSTRVLCW